MRLIVQISAVVIGIAAVGMYTYFVFFGEHEDHLRSRPSASANSPALAPASVHSPALEDAKDISIEQQDAEALQAHMDLTFSRFGSGFQTLNDIETTYWSNIERARAGDGAAMRQISRVLFNCRNALSIEGSAEAIRLFEEAAISLEQYEAILAQIDRCAPIIADQEADLAQLREKQYNGPPHLQWLRLAWEAGDQQARLEYLLDVPGQAQEMAKLLDQFVDARHPVVLDIASGFVAQRSPPEDSHMAAAWQFLACMSSESCSTSVYETGLREQFHQAEADEIVEFAKNFESLEANGISFVEVQHTRPYTHRSEQRVNAYLQLVEDTGSEGLIGIDAVMNMTQKPGDKESQREVEENGVDDGF